MKSSELKKIKKIPENRKKKVLFVNPKRSTTKNQVPHMGLAILASILKKRGHDVLIVDYNLVPNAPKISFFLAKFRPDIVGVSIYTANVKEANEIISHVNKLNPKTPLVVGGPHPTLYFDDMQKDRRVDYIVIGEAELLIIDVVEKSKKEKRGKIIRTREMVDPDDIPYPEYNVFYKGKYIRSYSIMTSRGCPYRCSFCPVAFISGRTWRPRKPEKCIEEIMYAMKTISPNLHVLIQDDNPLVDKERFYKFLRMYAEKIRLRLDVTNIRADTVNDELLMLLKRANCNAVGLGVEHAHPEVFRMVNKGETLEQIENAAKLVNKHKMLLSLCFVIGLPGDNLKRIGASIKFANKIKPDSIYWNMVMPYRGTEIRGWFEKNGKVYNEVGKTSLRDGDFRPEEPVAETSDFTGWERKKAYYLCMFRTIDDRLKPLELVRIFKEASEYGLQEEFIYWLPKGILRYMKRQIGLIRKAHAYSHREGITGLIRRAFFISQGK